MKGAIVQIDATPFRQYYEAHYGQPIGKRAKKVRCKSLTLPFISIFCDAKFIMGLASIFQAAEEGATEETEKKSRAVLRKLESRKADAKMDPHVEDQFPTGRLYAILSSRPGQSGRADGYILEGRELDFYRGFSNPNPIEMAFILNIADLLSSFIFVHFSTPWHH